MSTSMKTSTIGALGQPAARGSRRAVLWVAALVAAIVVAAAAAFTIHRVTTKTGTDTPTVTQQQTLPRGLNGDSSGGYPAAPAAPAVPRGLNGDSSSGYPAAPAAPHAPSRIVQLNQ